MGETFLLYGRTGWIGGHVTRILTEQGHTVHLGQARIENQSDVLRELELYKPTYVLNAAGVTGRPNIDWCEDNKQTTIRSNVIGTLSLVDACYQKGEIHVTNYSTGCIYEYDSSHPIGGKPFTETDPPNYDGSFYSSSKIVVEQLLASYPNVLTLRLRMPISDDLHHRSFITKIIGYEKVVNIPNSMTVLRELLPISIDMTKKKRKGVYNFTNPGIISHNEILQLYKEIVDPNFTWKNFTIEEHDRILKARRSNNELDVTKLLREYPNLPPIREAVTLSLQNIKKTLGK